MPSATQKTADVAHEAAPTPGSDATGKSAADNDASDGTDQKAARRG